MTSKPGYCIDCQAQLIDGEHWVCIYCEAEETLAREEKINNESL